MKLRVVELLLISTLPAMVLANKGLPPFGLTITTIFAGTLAAGSANAFNMVIESESDALMARTSKRPLVTGVISKAHATIFATAIGILSLVIFWFFTTPMATLMTLIAILFYVFVYTMGLKRRTNQNIVWGGAAGCMPVFIGWTAVTNSLSWAAVAFFMVIFFGHRHIFGPLQSNIRMNTPQPEFLCCHQLQHVVVFKKRCGFTQSP